MKLRLLACNPGATLEKSSLLNCFASTRFLLGLSALFQHQLSVGNSFFDLPCCDDFSFFLNDTGYYVRSSAFDFLPCSAVSQLVLALSLLSTPSSCMCMVLGGSCQSRKQFSLCSSKVSVTFEPKLLIVLLRTPAKILFFMFSVVFPRFLPTQHTNNGSLKIFPFSLLPLPRRILTFQFPRHTHYQCMFVFPILKPCP